MGSVGSLVERPDVSPTKTNRAVPQVRPKQANGLLKKGFTQRELLNYLNITKSVPRWKIQVPSVKPGSSSVDLLCAHTEKSQN